MAEAKLSKLYRSLAKGLITEAPILSFPEDATYDEVNFEIKRNGARWKRKGLELEDGGSLITAIEDPIEYVGSVSDSWVNTYSWRGAGNIGELSFLVVAQHARLEFFQNSDVALSDGHQPDYSINLNEYATGDIESFSEAPVQFSNGRGSLYVSHPSLQMLRVSYDDFDGMSVTVLEPKIRDLQGLDDELEPKENPTTLSNAHKYNLRNQGWQSGNVLPLTRKGTTYDEDPIEAYYSQQRKYPNNAEIVHLMKVENASKPQYIGRFDPRDGPGRTNFGNTAAPRGSYVLNAFEMDRSVQSGVAIANDTTNQRPRATAFMAGRLFFGGVDSGLWASTIFFSRIIRTEGDDEKCYQEGDPTAEIDSPLVPSDGGTISIPSMGQLKAMRVVDDSLILWASNGVWTVSGNDGGFAADSFSVRRVSEVGTNSPLSVVIGGSVPFYWGEGGIYRLAADKITGRLSEENISAVTIQTFFNDEIPAGSLGRVQGAYDPLEQRIYWLYNKEATQDQVYYVYDACLTMNAETLAFAPWTFQVPSAGDPALKAYVSSLAVFAGNTRTATNVDVVAFGAGSRQLLQMAYWEVEDEFAPTPTTSDILVDTGSPGANGWDLAILDDINQPQEVGGTIFGTSSEQRFWAMSSEWGNLRATGTAPGMNSLWDYDAEISFQFHYIPSDPLKELPDSVSDPEAWLMGDKKDATSAGWALKLYHDGTDVRISLCINASGSSGTGDLEYWFYPTTLGGGTEQYFRFKWTAGTQTMQIYEPDYGPPFAWDEVTANADTSDVGSVIAINKSSKPFWIGHLLGELRPTYWGDFALQNIEVLSPQYVGGDLSQDVVAGDANEYDVVVTRYTSTIGPPGLRFYAMKELGSGAYSTAWVETTSTSFEDLKDLVEDTTANTYPAYLRLGFEVGDDVLRHKQAQYVASVFNRVEDAYTVVGEDVVWDTEGKVTLQAKWDFHDSDTGNKWSPKEDVYRFPLRPWIALGASGNYDGGEKVIQTKTKVRGAGRALQLEYEVEEGYDCQLLGWQIIHQGRTNV